MDFLPELRNAIKLYCLPVTSRQIYFLLAGPQEHPDKDWPFNPHLTAPSQFQPNHYRFFVFVFYILNTITYKYPKLKPWLELVPLLLQRLLTLNMFFENTFSKLLLQCNIVMNVVHPVSKLGSKLLLWFERRYCIWLVKHSFETLNSHNLYLLNMFCFPFSNLTLHTQVQSKLDRFISKNVCFVVAEATPLNLF